ncbi:MAG: hypothetical protein ABIE74_03790 [Pseudomonadota bacterium]
MKVHDNKAAEFKMDFERNIKVLSIRNKKGQGFEMIRSSFDIIVPKLKLIESGNNRSSCLINCGGDCSCQGSKCGCNGQKNKLFE